MTRSERSERGEGRPRTVPGATPPDGDAGAGSMPRDPATMASLFSLLGEEVRVRILEELAEARRTGSGELSFSTLRERVGVEDSGRFNYHLGKLTGRLVAKGDGGYALTTAGRRLVASLSGAQGDPDSGVAGVRGWRGRR